MRQSSRSRTQSRRQVRSWMRNNADGFDSATQFAEAANAAIDLPPDAMNDDTHWVWEEAVSARMGRISIETRWRITYRCARYSATATTAATDPHGRACDAPSPLRPPASARSAGEGLRASR